MLWVHGHYNFVNSMSAGIVIECQNLTSKDGPRAERVKRNANMRATTAREQTRNSTFIFLVSHAIPARRAKRSNSFETFLVVLRACVRLRAGMFFWQNLFYKNSMFDKFRVFAFTFRLVCLTL